VLFGVCQRQRASPGAAKYLPLIYLQRRPQDFDIVDQVPGRIVIETCVRRAPAAAALIEQHDPVDIRIEEPPHIGVATAAGTAVEEYHRLAVRIAAFLVIHAMAVADIEHAGAIRLDRRIEGSSCRVFIHGAHYESLGIGKPWILNLVRGPRSLG
jgi:hypothetical protein